jgi:hypothetical protein
MSARLRQEQYLPDAGITKFLFGATTTSIWMYGYPTSGIYSYSAVTLSSKLQLR